MNTPSQFQKNFGRHMPAIFPLLMAFGLLLSLSFKKSAPSVESCRFMIIGKTDQITTLLERSIQKIEKNDHLFYDELIAEYDSARSCYASIEFFVEYYSAFDAANFINPKKFSDPDMPGFNGIRAQLQSGSANVNKLLKEYKLLNAKFRDLQRSYAEIDISQPQLLAAFNLHLQRMKRSVIFEDKFVDSAEQELFMNSLMGISEGMNHLTNDAYYSLLLEESNKTLKECMNKVIMHEGRTMDAAYFCSEIIDPVIEQMTQTILPEDPYKSEKIKYLLSQMR